MFISQGSDLGSGIVVWHFILTFVTLLGLAGVVSADPSRVTLNDNWRAEVIGGRVATLVLPKTDAVEAVVSQPAWGHVSKNPDGTIAVVLTGTDDRDGQISFDVALVGGERQRIRLTVTPSVQYAGWSQGHFYMLETDAQDNLIVEHGLNHRKVYISNGPRALTAKRIAKIEGIKPERIKRGWLMRNQKYGSTPELALSPGLGMQVWSALVNRRARPSSHWLLIERGYEYDNIKKLIEGGARGASPLHPIMVGAFGDGPRPVIRTPVALVNRPVANIVMRDLHLARGLRMSKARNVLLDDVAISNKPLTVLESERFTLRNSEVLDVVRDAPKKNRSAWHPMDDRVSGIFIANTTGVLIDGNLLDHNGWEPDYAFDMSARYGQPPSMFSHNAYLQWNNLDVTFRNTISMRGASYGAQVRSGGVIEGNVFLDNNAAVSFFGGNYQKRGPKAHYTLFADNIVTSGAHKRVADKQGALSLGIGDYGNLSTLLGSIIVHLADPQNPAEQSEKEVAHNPLDYKKKGPGQFYDDTIIYNWSAKRGAADNRNAEQVNAAVVDQATIQRFTEDVVGARTPTIAGFASHLRAMSESRNDDALSSRDVVAYFQSAFGIERPQRSEAAMMRFVPNGLADGIRWDNRLNWPQGGLPGDFAGDSVDLAGNHVKFGGTALLEQLRFGEMGGIAVTQGYLNVRQPLEAGENAAQVFVNGSGQFWINGIKGAADIDARGGRFANTGDILRDVSVSVGGDVQAILATPGATLKFAEGESLRIIGGKAQTGFDGTPSKDVARLTFAPGSVLQFSASEGGLSAVREFHSGRFGTQQQDVNSSVEIDGATLRLDLAGVLNPDKVQELLISADSLSGAFAKLEVSGLLRDREATVLVDYDTNAVFLELSARGSGSGTARLVIQRGGKRSESLQADIIPVKPIPTDITLSFL